MYRSNTSAAKKMNRSGIIATIVLSIILMAAIVSAATDSSSLFLNGLGFGTILNYGNINSTNSTFSRSTITTLVLPSPITACPSGSGWSYYNGTNAVCSVFGNISGLGTINQLPKFTASGTIGDSGIMFDGSNMTIGTQNTSVITFQNASGLSQISTDYTRFYMTKALDLNGSLNMTGKNITGIDTLSNTAATAVGIRVASNMTLQGNVNMTSSGTCLYLPSGGRLCGNSTCALLYSPAGTAVMEACDS